MNKIFCISGLGADEKVFSNLDIPGYELVIIKWLIPFKKESIEKYAERLLPQITEEIPILLGLSFGGIICIEINKIIKTKLIILLSSIKSRNEMPFWMRLVNFSRLHKIYKPKSYGVFEFIQNYNLGVKTNQEKKMVAEYRRKIDPIYLHWAIDVILKWKNNCNHKNIYHLHGTKDKLFPVKNIKYHLPINHGGHLMVFSRSKEINDHIIKILYQ